MTLHDPRPIAREISRDLQVSEAVEEKSIDLIDTAAEKNLLTGKKPSGIAAGAVYAATLVRNEKITQEELYKVSGVSHPTVRKRYRELLEAQGIYPEWEPRLDQEIEWKNDLDEE